jgi:hypothetical protein
MRTEHNELLIAFGGRFFFRKRSVAKERGLSFDPVLFRDKQ